LQILDHEGDTWPLLSAEAHISKIQPFYWRNLCVLLRGSWLFYNIRFVGLDSMQWDNSVCEFLLYTQHVSESLKDTNDQTSDSGFDISEH
jgi:hypothetical protein